MDIPLYKPRKNFTGNLKAFKKIDSEQESVSFKKLFSLNSPEMKKERNLINYRRSCKSVNVEDDLKSVHSRMAIKETLTSHREGGRQKMNNIIQNYEDLNNKNKSSVFTNKESKLNLRMKYIDSIIFAIIVLNISLSLWENNIFTQSSLNNGEIVNFKVNDTVNTLRWICLVLSLSIVIILIFRYTISLRLLRLKNLAGAKDGIITTGLWKYLLLEIIINLIFSPPYLEGSFSGRMLKGTYTYSFDTIINFLVFFKLYYTVRLIYVISPFLSENAKTVSKKHKMNLSLAFALKCHLRRRPFLTLSILFPIFVCIFGLIVRTFEFGFVDDYSEEAGKTKTNPSFENYFNSFWLIITTMLTIGYGDIYPKSHLGRIVLFISVVVGMILVSLMIVFLSNLIYCSPEENKVHTLVEIDKVREKLRVKASEVVKRVLLLFMFKEKWKLAKDRTKRLTNYLTQIFILRCIHIEFLKQLKQDQSISLPTDDLLKNLNEKLEMNIKTFSQHCQTIDEIKSLTGTIVKEEEEIKRGMFNIRKLQNEITNFLVTFNNQVDMENLNLEVSHDIHDLNPNSSFS
jgi:hypothetical protein